MSFHAGQKVRCVNDDVFRDEVFCTYPQKGAEYHIREVCAYSDGAICVRLVEIVNPILLSADKTMKTEPMFLACRFRPLIERKTDISFAHEILRKHTKKQGVDA